MRIIGGIYRHRLINYPENREDIRPTKDRVREAIFSILGEKIISSKVLDLYAGSGSMGLEALSRGASFIDFVDITTISRKVVTDNLFSLKITPKEYTFHLMEDFKALEMFKKDNKSFDIIILDPPYKFGKYEELIDFITNNDLLNENGIIVCESDRKINKELPIYINKEYKYGEILVTIYRRK